ncbi:MAG: cysteine synthase A [Lentihominibacter sp.]|jgi:cysteine synthase A
MKVYNTITDLIGNTPLLRLNKIEKNNGIQGTQIIAKLEYFNPAGSIKDRTSYNMVIEAEKSGELKPGGIIIEPTSGNTGIGLAMTAAARGYKAIIVMPDNMTAERISLMEALGAELYLTPAVEGMSGCVAKAEQLAAKIPGSITAGQFINPANTEAHIHTTGPEIWEDTDGEIDILVATFGTGGTITGAARYLKDKKPEIKVIGVEPAESPLITEGYAGPHDIPGIGADFKPDLLDTEVIDQVVTVTSKEALEMTKDLARTEGVLAGISSGAAVCAALREASDRERNNKTGRSEKIVVILPDTGERYLSILAG